MSSEPHFSPPVERSLVMHEGTSYDEGVSTLALVNALLRRRVLIVVLPLVLVGLLALTEMTPARDYESSAAFMPQGTDSRARMAGLAAQFGIAVPSVDGGLTPAFYVELIGSREILESLVRAQYTFEAGGERHSGNLIELFEIRGTDPRRRLEKAVKRLGKLIDAEKSRETNVVNVSVTTEWPQLSYEILTRLLKAIDDFNQTTRKSQAGSERGFVEARLTDAAGELRLAEDRLREFLRANRTWNGSPDLILEHDRLERIVMQKQQVYTMLAQNFEQARIDEVRNTPVLTMIARPNLPALPVSRRLIVKGALTAAVGAILAALIALGGALVERRAPGAPSDLEEFRALRRATFADLRNPFRPIGRAFRRRRA